MSIIGAYTGAYLGVKLVNGKIKPRYGKGAVILNILLDIGLIVAIVTFIHQLLNIGSADIELLIALIVGIPAIAYIILITPYQQNPNNYYIEFVDENTLEGFKLFYKNKLVKIDYKVDGKGKIAFKENEHKLHCINYADNSQMSNFTRYRIINYFSKWLNDNNLISDELTATFEEI